MTIANDMPACTCLFGFRTLPSAHAPDCDWRKAWDEFWSDDAVDTRRREIFTEAYNQQREDKPA